MKRPHQWDGVEKQGALVPILHWQDSFPLVVRGVRQREREMLITEIPDASYDCRTFYFARLGNGVREPIARFDRFLLDAFVAEAFKAWGEGKSGGYVTQRE